MSYIAADSNGSEWILPSKPTRFIGTTYSWWICPGNQSSILVPKGTAKALYNAGLLRNCVVALNIRDLNWRDDPIELRD